MLKEILMNEAITTQVMVFTNGRIAIQLWADEGPYARLNVNLPDEAFADDEIAINWDLDDSVLKSILDLNKSQKPIASFAPDTPFVRSGKWSARRCFRRPRNCAADQAPYEPPDVDE
jgi:hypothetical protein